MLSDNIDIFFSTAIWSILNPRKIRRGVIKLCWSLYEEIITRFELNLNVVDVLLKVPTTNHHEKYVQWGASRFIRRAYLPKTFFCLPFCGTFDRQKHLPSTSRYVLTDTHLYVSSMATASITAKKLFLFSWRICRFSNTLSPDSKFGRTCVDHCLVIYQCYFQLQSLKARPLRRAIPSSRAVLPNVIRCNITLYSYNV